MNNVFQMPDRERRSGPPGGSEPPGGDDIQTRIALLEERYKNQDGALKRIDGELSRIAESLGKLSVDQASLPGKIADAKINGLWAIGGALVIGLGAVWAIYEKLDDKLSAISSAVHSRPQAPSTGTLQLQQELEQRNRMQQQQRDLDMQAVPNNGPKQR